MCGLYENVDGMFRYRWAWLATEVWGEGCVSAGRWRWCVSVCSSRVSHTEANMSPSYKPSEISFHLGWVHPSFGWVPEMLIIVIPFDWAWPWCTSPTTEHTEQWPSEVLALVVPGIGLHFLWSNLFPSSFPSASSRQDRAACWSLAQFCCGDYARYSIIWLFVCYHSICLLLH